MGNYRFNDDLHKKKQLPAGQRGIGCMLLLLLPIISYVGAVELLKIKTIQSIVYRISPTLFGAPSIPKILWKVKSINPFLNEVYSWTNLEANLLVALFLLLILSGVIGVIYAIMYRAVAPSRYGPQDAPPPRHKPTKRSR